MKQIVWRNDDQMVFESGHKTFDAQTNLIGTGNIIANTLYGRHIRPFTETECNGFTRPEGHLQDFDLGWFTNIPLPVRRYIEDHLFDESGWLYSLHHYTGSGFWKPAKKIVHGWVLTTSDYKLRALFYTGPTYKSDLVVDEAALYLGDKDPDRPDVGYHHLRRWGWR
jgi:hypothetical protein